MSDLEYQCPDCCFPWDKPGLVWRTIDRVEEYPMRCENPCHAEEFPLLYEVAQFHSD